MAKKIYMIPIEGEEELAMQFINAICLARDFSPSSNELNEEELSQEKLNFVGRIAGMQLREIAESKMKQMLVDQAISSINQQFEGVGDALQVNNVKVLDGSN